MLVWLGAAVACGSGQDDVGATPPSAEDDDENWPQTSGGMTTDAASSGESSGAHEDASGSTGPELPTSRCVVGPDTITCAHQTVTLFTGPSGAVPREVHWQVPLGEPPASGWPAVFVFQGSLFTAELFWTAVNTDAFGYWNQGLLTKALLDAGFAVITPEAQFEGNTAWETNIPPMSLAWEQSNDHAFMLDLFAELDAGTFGSLDVAALYATGISSGGYMTSRMDEAYRTRFRALAIQSGSYATCGGPACVVPTDLSSAHRPTLFLHGAADVVVPVWTMELYRDALDAAGAETQTIIADAVGHAWIDEAPAAIVTWFESH